MSTVHGEDGRNRSTGMTGSNVHGGREKPAAHDKFWAGGGHDSRGGCAKCPGWSGMEICSEGLYSEQQAAVDMTDPMIRRCADECCGVEWEFYESNMIGMPLMRKADYEGCERGARVSEEGSAVTVPSKQHGQGTMLDHARGVSAHESSGGQRNVAVESGDKRICCRQHPEQGLMNVCRRCCGREGCDLRASSGVKRGEVIRHRKPAEVDMTVGSGRCAHEGCSKLPRFGMEGSKVGVYCRQHAERGMVSVTSKHCAHKGCSKRASFGVEGSKVGVYCRQHTEDGMVDVVNRRCSHDGCGKRASFGVKSSKVGVFCGQHAEDDMFNVHSKRCSREGCSKRASFGTKGSKVAVYCRQHAEDSMCNVLNRRCSHEGCSVSASFGVEGSKGDVYCRRHAEDGMFDVLHRRCSHKGCSIRASFGVKGSKEGTFCRRHAEDGMVNVRSRCCAHEGCSKRATFGLEGSRVGLYCGQHGEGGMVNVNRCCAHEGCRKASTFDLKGRKVSVYCREHTEDGEVDVLNGRCAHEGCRNVSTFGVRGSKVGTYCRKHGEDGMVYVAGRVLTSDEFSQGHCPTSQARLGVEVRQFITSPKQAKHELGGVGAPKCRGRESVPTPDETRRGDGDDRRVTKKVRKAAEDLSRFAVKSAHEGTRWCDVKVETCFPER